MEQARQLAILLEPLAHLQERAASQQHQQQSPAVHPNVDRIVDPTVDPRGDPTRIGQPNEPLLLQQIANRHSLDSLR